MFSKHRQMLLQRLAHRTSVVGLHRLLVVTHRRVEVARGNQARASNAMPKTNPGVAPRLAA